MVLLKDEVVYHECRDYTKSIHSKVLKQLLELTTQLDQNSRINASNPTLQVTTALLPDFKIYQKLKKPTFPSDLKYQYVAHPLRK